MSIICKICNTEFSKIIPWQHLKTHNISSADYKSQHGSLYSEETLSKFSAREPHNKGVGISEEQKEKLRKKAIERNKVWRETNSHPNTGRIVLAETRQKIKEKRQHQVMLPESAKKALATKIANGHDLAPFRGKTHTAETKKKISVSSKRSNLKKSQVANATVLEKISSLQLCLTSDISETQLQLLCNVCKSEFTFTKQYFHDSKFKTSLCPTCFPRTSNSSTGERELHDYIVSLCPDSVANYRKSYHSKELDIYVPSLNIGFEYNGLYWHSETVLLHNNKSPKSDYEKQKQFADIGIKIIQIFEDEWQNHKDIVQSRIKNILQKTNTTVYARQCTLEEISSQMSSKFLNSNHLMGNGRSNRRFGLFYKNELISVMTFTNSNLSRKLNTWELNRFASKLDYKIVGGASRLFKRFIAEVNPTTVISYSDNRWSSGNLYKTLGFSQQHNGTPSYWYFLPNALSRIHRYSLRKFPTDNQMLTERENRTQQGYSRVWDSGHAKWLWSK